MPFFFSHAHLPHTPSHAGGGNARRVGRVKGSGEGGAGARPGLPRVRGDPPSTKKGCMRGARVWTGTGMGAFSRKGGVWGGSRDGLAAAAAASVVSVVVVVVFVVVVCMLTEREGGREALRGASERALFHRLKLKFKVFSVHFATCTCIPRLIMILDVFPEQASGSRVAISVTW